MSATDSDLGDFVTGKDDNVSGFSECEISDVGVSQNHTGNKNERTRRTPSTA